MGRSIPGSTTLKGTHAGWNTHPRPHGSGGAARHPGNGKVGAGEVKVGAEAEAEARVAGPKCKRKQTTRRCFEKTERLEYPRNVFNTLHSQAHLPAIRRTRRDLRTAEGARGSVRGGIYGRREAVGGEGRVVACGGPIQHETERNEADAAE